MVPENIRASTPCSGRRSARSRRRSGAMRRRCVAGSALRDAIRDFERERRVPRRRNWPSFGGRCASFPRPTRSFARRRHVVPRRVRPPLQTMKTFIDGHRGLSRVEPIRKELPMAPSIDREPAARRADPGREPARQCRDAGLHADIRRLRVSGVPADDGLPAAAYRPRPRPSVRPVRDRRLVPFGKAPLRHRPQRAGPTGGPAIS